MIPEDLKYTAEHEWVRTPGESEASVRIGITDYAQDQLGDIVYLQLPDEGSEVEAGSSIGELESTKSVSELYAPIQGTVVKTNAAAEQSPEVINSDPYGAGWLIEIRPSDPPAVDGLLDAATYRSQVESG
ncbi:MAG: glycine cleavage system protein GcvH [Propionibacteriales bacterium]|nr:glycine cleavage system protein GcvH [Propionibacteriales bacterium]